MSNVYTRDRFISEFLHDNQLDVFFIQFTDKNSETHSGYIIKIWDKYKYSFKLLLKSQVQELGGFHKDYLVPGIQKQLEIKYKNITDFNIYHPNIPYSFVLINAYHHSYFNTTNSNINDINIPLLFKHLNFSLLQYEEKEKDT